MYTRRRLHTLFTSTFGLLLVLGGLLSAAGVARGQTSYEILHSFNASDVAPTAGVIRDSAGTLYGATEGGGETEVGSTLYGGTVYKLDASGRFTVLHSFNTFDRSDGISPSGGVIRDSAGTLYGATFGGGAFGAGTVYKLDASGVLTVLHSFNYYPDGYPTGEVIRDSTGTLYGATSNGGGFGKGAVYKLDASGGFTLLHSFNGSDGFQPWAGVIRDSAGTLYGTTGNGGTFGWGVVYKLDSSGRFTVLHSFNGSDGAGLTAGVIRDSAGTLYGATVQGGAFGYGTVYKLDASGVLTTLHSFTGPDGAIPFAGVIRDSAGTLYGATVQGGAFGYGTVYKLDASGVLTTLHSFNGSDGASPNGVIRDSAGNLYGAAASGGPGGVGVLYRLTLAPAVLDCSTATASVDFPRLGNRHRYPVTIQGVTASDGGPVTLAITSIFQDEPVTNPTGKTCPDGLGVGTDVAKVRNERIITAAGDGRVYHIGFTATDEVGESCTGEVQVCVPVNEGEECGDQGALFDSTVCP